MKILVENINLHSTTGPNHFGAKLIKYVNKLNVTCGVNVVAPTVRLCFIETLRPTSSVPLVQRIDGLYYNAINNYKAQNTNIYNTYKKSQGVIFQTAFNKEFTFQFFGPHENCQIIHNGADLELIETIKPLSLPALNKFDKVWTCAAQWRAVKRLNENIRYFLECGGDNDCLVIAGENPDVTIKHERIFYAGKLDIRTLYALFKRSDYFIHLAWLDHCPNVVIDARACGNEIICAESGGVQEIAGNTATIVTEIENWDFKPRAYKEFPKLNFKKTYKNIYNSEINMHEVATQYIQFLKLK